jgi:hypothetical protein
MVTIENILTGLYDKMKLQIDLEIDVVNAANTDFEIDKIPDMAWFEGSLDESINNFNHSCFYFIDDLQSIVNGPMVVSSVSIEFDLIVAQKSDSLDYKRILRYQHALMKSASEAWGKVGVGYDKATITALNPIDVKLFNSSHWSKVIGIRFEFNLLN